MVAAANPAAEEAARVSAPTSPACPGVVASATWDAADSLRGELFTVEHLEEHGRAIANAHGAPSLEVAPGRLRERFRSERVRIREVYATLAREAPRKRELSPAEEWLLDNSHVVEDQLREIEEDLPGGYLRELPRMAGGAMAGYPLVYGLCIDYLRHTDARIELDALARFVLAYQSVRPLTIGELWAVPIMLRLGLVLTVGTLASAEVNSHDRERAEAWAAALLKTEHDDRSISAVLARLASEGGPPTPAFLVHLVRRLREQDAPARDAFQWIREECGRLGLTPEELTRRQHLRQAADQLSVGNAITSMRAIGALDWNRFFERTSVVEAVLQRDPAGAYEATDDASRDRYRHAVEDIARRSTSDERKVAETAITLAAQAHAATPEDVGKAHVGYWLVDEGRDELERVIGYRRRLRSAVTRFALRHPSFVYFGSLLAATTALVALVAGAAEREGPNTHTPLSLVVVAALVFALPASELAVTVVNAFLTPLLRPRLLAKLALSKGVPPEHRTLVVVPALLDSEAGIRELVAELEIRSLANTDENLHFALLTDFTDHDEASHPDDDHLLATVRAAIDEINRRYHDASDRYLLLHRKRLHNPAQGRFMGWERKRGKLEELNSLLRGATDTTFTVVTADPALLASVRYVITLDADTALPREVARKLVATIAHPLNRPRLSKDGSHVVRGYGVIQPRVGTDPVSARRTRLSRIMAGELGIDPYTTAISDVYQDLFGEGSYIGKAIYDVDAFTAALHGRVPENHLLSHDLFEGLRARTALATDIELLDGQPASYAVVAAREHRWIRGDWQLLRWLWTHVPTANGSKENDLSLLGRWKLFDNLRRSLVAPALVLWIALGAVALPRLAWLTTLTGLLVLVAPLLSSLVLSVARPRSVNAPPILATLRKDVPIQLLQRSLAIVFLLDRALVAGDAIVRTLYRLLVSRRHLLEWQTMGETERSAARGDALVAGRLVFGAIFAALLLAAEAVLAPVALPFVAPILLLWAAAPFVARWLSKPLPPRERGAPLSRSDRRELRLVARKTWGFFETFVTAGEGFLPPDNYQEEPRGVVAHRTSPTNIGLYLLSTVAAKDFGYVTLGELVRRLDATLTTVERLEKREGHILNWYDTTTQKPLEPHYISTVDSGNLAAYLWTLRQACIEACQSPLLGVAPLDGAIDAILLSEAEEPSADPVRGTALVDTLEAAKADPGRGWVDCLPKLRALAEQAAALPGARPEAPSDDRPAGSWVEDAGRTLALHAAELARLAPWAELLARAPEGLAAPESELRGALSELEGAKSLDAIAAATAAVVPRLEALEAQVEAGSTERVYLASLREAAAASHDACEELREALVRLGERAVVLADGMNFAFLYNRDRGLFAIGYNVSSARIDGSHYDLLASEARLASLVAIAKGDAPQEHWFRMGRPRAAAAGGTALLSWSGSMFEYLMPLLVTKTHEHTLLDETYDAAVLGQRAYGALRDVPWGISESAYNIMDLSMTYQYRAFGVPGFGLKAGLEEDLVVAPYATALAALVRPDLALENLRALRAEGLEGEFGYYESIDFTQGHAPPGRRGIVVKAFMAHHQGMILVALDSVLCGAPMQRRFHADRRIQASELLLEERAPVAAPVVELRGAAVAPPTSDVEADVVEHVGLGANGPLRAHLLGHGELSTLVTTVGTGVTRWKGLDVHRNREDGVLGESGIFVYLRDLTTGAIWSAGHQPTAVEPDRYDAAFSPHSVHISRRDGDLETLLEIGVSAEHPAEVRRVTLTNHAAEAREIELTTYTELVLAPHEADVAHRAFSGLFVETEALADKGALLAKRRPRAAGETPTWAIQVLTNEDSEWTGFELDSSRADFIGRGRTVACPIGLERPLGGTSGAVLDPAMILRRRVRIEPGQRARIALTTALAESRDAAVALVDTFAAVASIARTFELGWADARVELRHLGMTGAQADRYQRLLSAVLFPNPLLRGGVAAASIQGNTKDTLWGIGVSGDLPILVLRLDDSEFHDLLREALLAQEFWRINGAVVDLVVLNEEPGGYNQPFQDRALALIASSPAQGRVDQRGGVFVRRTQQLSPAQQALVLGAARVVLVSSAGSLGRQLRAASVPAKLPPPRVWAKRPAPAAEERMPPRPTLVFDNGLGGFSEDGREYVLRLDPGAQTPAPWSNVIANPSFGCVVSESGATVTWSINSQSHRLTPWSNDPVSDPSGDAVYLRDDDDGSIWSPTPGPAGAEGGHEIRHGQGYTTFSRTKGALEQHATVFVAKGDPIKVFRLRLTNRGAEPRRISACNAVEWVLGNSRERGRLTIVSETDDASGAQLVRNPFSGFPERRAFLAATKPVTSFTCDREEFFGRGGTRARPAGLTRGALSGRVGAGLDPCSAVLVALTIAPGETVEVSFVLGEGANVDDARRLVALYREEAQIEAAYQEAVASWDELLGAVTVETPDRALDLLLNRWVLYQALSSRIWGRSAFYQSGGAYGFRDQLQDVLALVHTRPDLTRAHLLVSAARQFAEGDVQHWWHAETGEGVRTHCSDDMLWLPFVTAEYVRATGDSAVLGETIPFLEERSLSAADHDLFSNPRHGAVPASLYEHCTRALDRGATRGAHGLPLMGGGDWNDGMSAVGAGGAGESVWLGWFLARTMQDFSPLAAARGDHARVQSCAAIARDVVAAIERTAWDGGWYRRAFFDDGTPLGSHENDECAIDAIAQSWSVISGLADPARAAASLQATEERLVRADDGMILLFAPPFERSAHDPGYIQAYPAGVRENGGQYTHGVLWTVLARTLQGDGQRAGELLSLLNPIHHATTPEGVKRYGVEPYVVAADVYSAAGHVGRGGWTWYTGSAAWLYRIALEHLLGIRLSGGRLTFDPCVPPSWQRYAVTYRRGGTTLRITIENPNGVSRAPCRVELDGREVRDGAIEIPTDGKTHEVRVVLTPSSEAVPELRSAS